MENKSKDTVDIYESTVNSDSRKNKKIRIESKPQTSPSNQDVDGDIEKEEKTLSILDFSRMVKDFDKTNTTVDETIRDLDYTLTKKEPKRGIWLLEQGEDIDYLDHLSMEEGDFSRARGRHTWNTAIENIINTYAPDYNIDDEYDALKIMEQNFKTKRSVNVKSEEEFKESDVQKDVETVTNELDKTSRNPGV